MTMTRTPDDVLASLSAFPAPPNHIPASSYFASSRYTDVPPHTFSRNATKVPWRRDSAASGKSTASAQSGKLSVLVNGRNLEYGRDSDTGDSARTGRSEGGAIPSPVSARSYYTAPNSPLPPGTPGAGPSSGTAGAISSSSRSAYPHSASPASAYPSSSSSNSAYPHSPAYSSRYMYPSPSLSSPASVNSNLSPGGPFKLPSAYAPSSARAALTMLSTLPSALASSSSSPSSAHVPTSAVGMSPIKETDEKPRRQLSAPPSNHRRQKQSRQKPESESGSEIGGPPSLPLPPLPTSAPSTAKLKRESTPTPTPTPRPSRAPPSVRSLPSLRSSRSGKSGHGHVRKDSGVSVVSTTSATSAFSTTAPSLAEFGVTKRSRVEVEGEREGPNEEKETPKSRAKAPRAGAVSLRIDIPSTYVQDQEYAMRQQQKEKSLGSGNSSTSPIPRDELVVDRVNSPTASLFSVASVMTTRSGMSTAQSLRTRVSGMLGGLGNVLGPVPSTTNGSAPASTNPSPSPNGGGREDERAQRPGLLASTSSVSMSSSASINGSSSLGNTNGLLVAEDLHAEPLLARAVTPVTPVKNARGAPSSSPLELSSMGRTLRAMRAGVGSPQAVPSRAHVLPLSDAEMDGYEGGRETKLSSGLLGQFPSTPTAGSRPPPSSFPFPGSSSHRSPMRTPTSAANGGTGISRTVSQSRRKPLPPAPHGSRTSTASSVSTLGSFESARSRTSSSKADGATTAHRGRTRAGRGADVDGAASPDIAAMMCATPRPVLRSKSTSARSRHSTKSPSDRSSSVRSSVRSTTRDRARPSLPDERERQKALARVSAVSSYYSASSLRVSNVVRKDLSARRSAGSGLADAYGGIEEDADYGITIARHRGGYDLSPSLLHVDESFEGDIDGFGTLRARADGGAFCAKETEVMLGGSLDRAEEESDSDIDLHTPLPHILLREGVLSPHSKVLSSASSSSSLSVRSSFLDSGRDSVASHYTNVSFGSAMTKSGLFKDERNTEGRRRRHRDGKNLRGGLGLTTGLGWSDSEDEDAPC